MKRFVLVCVISTIGGSASFAQTPTTPVGLEAVVFAYRQLGAAMESLVKGHQEALANANQKIADMDKGCKDAPVVEPAK